MSVQRWLTHAVIDEFSRIEQIKGQRAHNLLTAAKPRRQAVATALADFSKKEVFGGHSGPQQVGQARSGEVTSGEPGVEGHRQGRESTASVGLGATA